MSANQTSTFTAEDRLFLETPMEFGSWGLTADTMVPARHVVWASVALIVVTLCVLAFG